MPNKITIVNKGESNLERIFETVWKMLAPDMPTPAREHRFAPDREWRFDFAFIDKMVAIEIDGGVHTGGRHTRGKGFEGDCDKLNAAALLGWRVLRFTANHLNKRPSKVVEQVRSLLQLSSRFQPLEPLSDT